MKIRHIVFLFVALVLCSCNRTPDGVLGKEQMARLLADIHKAEIVVETNTRTYNDSLKRVLRQSVYAKHGLTSEQVDSSLSWYGYNMEKYVEVYDRTIEILEKERDEVLAKGVTSEITASDYLDFEGDSVDIWQGARYMRLNTSTPVNVITFNLLADRNWIKGDAYTLRNKLINSTAPLDITLAVKYTDGTGEYINRQINGDGWHDVRLSLNKDKDAVEVNGVISFRPVKGFSMYVDSIALIRTRENEMLSAESRNAMKSFRFK